MEPEAALWVTSKSVGAAETMAGLSGRGPLGGALWAGCGVSALVSTSESCPLGARQDPPRSSRWLISVYKAPNIPVR